VLPYPTSDGGRDSRSISTRLASLFRSCSRTQESAESPVKMSFTIIKSLGQLPSYPVLCELAEQHHVRVIGNEHTGSFSSRGVEGDYAADGPGIRGRFVSHGVIGEFSFVEGNASVTVLKKPFWLPEMVLKQKITEGLDTFCKKLAPGRSA
jgi:hypothetical protein